MPSPIDADALSSFAPSGSWATLVGVPADIAPPGPLDEGGSAGWVAPTVIVFAVVLAAVVTVIVALKRRPPR
jgi:hypothetical protein